MGLLKNLFREDLSEYQKIIPSPIVYKVEGARFPAQAKGNRHPDNEQRFSDGTRSVKAMVIVVPGIKKRVHYV